MPHVCGGCLVTVWKVSGISQEGVWQVFGKCQEVGRCLMCLNGELKVSKGCLRDILRVSGMCQEGVWNMSRRCLKGKWKVQEDVRWSLEQKQIFQTLKIQTRNIQFFWTNIFWTQHVLDLTILSAKIFWTPTFF